MPDSQSSDLGFESSLCYRFEVWEFSLSSRDLSSLGFMAFACNCCMAYPPPTTQQQRLGPYYVQVSKTTTNSFTIFHCANQFWRVIRARLIVGVSDGRKTTLIRDSINCCHRHDVSSLALVSPSVNIRRPASQWLLKCQTRECPPSRI